jgi:uncharacterized membrane protein
MESPFTELNTDDIEKEVSVFFKDSFSFHKKLNNKVSEMLKDKVSEFKLLVPNIQDLGNKNMRARHYEKIFKLIKENYYADMPFTLLQLMKGLFIIIIIVSITIIIFILFFCLQFLLCNFYQLLIH